MSIQIVRELHWPAFVAMLAAAGVYLALPAPLSLGPSWLLLAVIVLLLIPIVSFPTDVAPGTICFSLSRPRIRRFCRAGQNSA
jgi:hypothetical protein